MRHYILIPLLTVTSLCLSVRGFADVLYLKSGEKIEGKITLDSINKNALIKTENGTFTYPYDQTRSWEWSDETPTFDTLNVIQREKLDFQAVDISPFFDLGCVKITVPRKDSLIYHREPLNCSGIGLEEKHSLSDIVPPSEYLSGLTPKVSFVTGHFQIGQRPQGDGIIQSGGCRRPIYSVFLVLNDGQITLLNNKQKFMDFFAPVESVEEALSFAVALTGSSPEFEITVPNDQYRKHKIYSPEVSTTFVEEVPGGYKVRLFTTTPCPCPGWAFSAVDYLVTKDGLVTEASRKTIYGRNTGGCTD